MSPRAAKGAKECNQIALVMMRRRRFRLRAAPPKSSPQLPARRRLAVAPLWLAHNVMDTPEDQSHAPAPLAVDKLGVVASGACAVHCAATAFAPTLLGMVGLGALMGHRAEWGFTIAAVLFAAMAIVVGWRAHGSNRVTALLSLGILGLFASRAIEESGWHDVGTVVGVLAGATVVAGHLLNIRATRAA